MSSIEYIFRKKLKNHKVNVPDDLWADIEAALDHKQRLSLFHIIKIAAVVTILLSVGAAMYSGLNNKMDVSYHNNTQISEVSTQDVSMDDSNLITETPTQSVAEITTPTHNVAIEIQDANRTPNSNIIKEIIETPAKLKSLIAKFETNNIEFRSITQNYNPNSEILASNDIVPEISDDKKDRDPLRWDIGAQFAPVYSFRNLSSGTVTPTEQKYYNEVESGVTSQSYGIQIAVVPTKRFSIETGVRYSKIGQQLQNINVYYNTLYNQVESPVSTTNSFTIQNSLGELNFESPFMFIDETNKRVNVSSYNKIYFDESDPNVINLDATLTQTFEYLEIPLILKYKFLDKKVDMSFSAGVTTNYLIGNNVQLVYNDKTDDIGSTNNIKQFNYTSIAGIDIAYPVNSFINIHVSPMAQYYLGSINSGEIESRPYTFGLYTGLSFNF